MNLFELLAQLPGDVILEYTGLAPAAAGNPCAAWVSRILARELARRKDEPEVDVPPLELDPSQLGFALQWLEFSAARFGDAGLDRNLPGLVLLGALFAHVRKAIELRATSATH